MPLTPAQESAQSTAKAVVDLMTVCASSQKPLPKDSLAVCKKFQDFGKYLLKAFESDPEPALPVIRGLYVTRNQVLGKLGLPAFAPASPAVEPKPAKKAEAPTAEGSQQGGEEG